MSDKTFAQKGIEKTLMLERHQNFSLMLAQTPDGPALIVGLNDESGSFTPLAKVLTKREIDDMTPKFNTREWLDDQLDKARCDITHTKPADFTNVKPLPYLTASAIPNGLF